MLNWWNWQGDFNPIHRLACFKGGSHGSGTVKYSDYIEFTHASWLYQDTPNNAATAADQISQSIVETLNTAFSATPYASEVYPDPDADITLIETELSELDTLADARDPQTDWEAYIDKILLKLGDTALFPAEDIIDSLSTKITAAITAATSVLSSAPVTNAVTAHENAQMNRFMRSTGRWAAGMADINAVQTSSFIIGLALRESDFQYQMEAFQANLNLDIYRSSTSQALEKYLSAVIQRHGNRDLYLTRATQELINLLNTQVNLSKVNFDSILEQKRQKFVTLAEEQNYNLMMDVEEALWDLKLFEFGGNLLGAPAGGGAVVGEGVSGWRSALSGAASGAAIGANFGPIGAGVGALTGGLIGAFG